MTALRMTPRKRTRSVSKSSTAFCAEAVEVLWPSKTRTTPSVMTDKMAASLSAITGGESIRINSNRCRSSFRISFILREPNSSLGFGGGTPRESSESPLTGVSCIPSSSNSPPVNTLESPRLFVNPSRLWQQPLRMSASTNNTLCPSRARAIARFKLVTVLPSPGEGLVRRITCGGLSA